MNVRPALDRDGPSPTADERGMVVVWFAIMLVLFLSVAAFAIDVAYWHLVKGREQRAADAAALAGAVNYPGNQTEADAAATDVAGSNGYSVNGIVPVASGAECPLVGTLTVCGGPGTKSYQYKVTVAQQVDNIFGGIFGIHKATVRASATAEYLKPLAMGSPSNQFGNDPDETSWPINTSAPHLTFPNFWANVAGGHSPKVNGDTFAANYCNANVDGCSAADSYANIDYNPKGYFYTVDFTGTATVNLQAFDPGYVDVGDFCTGANNLGGAAALTNVPGYPQGDTNTADINKRYKPVTDQNNQQDPGFQYCTGDQLLGGPPPTTTFTVLKASVPGDPSTAQQVCQVTYPGFQGDLAAMLGFGGTVPGAPAQLSKYFRQWATLCQISGVAGEEYFIQVSTDTTSGGHNRFALRATSGGGPTSQVQIAGNAAMGIYANVGGNQLTQFYLARVPTAAAGHKLVLNFFDIGDASSQGTLQVVPPVDSNVGATFPGCQWTGNSSSGALGYAANTARNPWGDFAVINDCLITGVNGAGTWNGQWSTVTVPIPFGYKCQDDDPQGCWLKINYLFAGGVSDTTSWNAFLLGDPVRLTQ